MDYENSLEMIEKMIATDSRDWCEDYRSAVIYGIVFGMDDDAMIKDLMDRFEFSSDMIADIQRQHQEWIKLKEILKLTNNLSNEQSKEEEPTTPSLK